MQRQILLDIEKLPEGYYVATSKDVQGLVAQGKTFEEVVDIAKSLSKDLLTLQESANDEKMPITERILYPLTIAV